jgi:hypothetical protein
VPPVRRLTPADLDHYRQRLYRGDSLEPADARLLLAEVAALRDDLARQRVEFAAKAAAALEKRLEAVAVFNHGGRPQCRDAEARAFLAKLKRVVEEGGKSGRLTPPRRP